MKTSSSILSKQIFILMLLAVLYQNVKAQTSTNQTEIKHLKTQPTSWNMFGPARVQIQDFTVTDLYADTANGKLNGNFLDKANLGLGIGFYQQLSNKLAVSGEFQFGYGYISKRNPLLEDAKRAWSQSLRTDLYYYFYQSQSSLKPYLFAGLQGTYKKGLVSLTSPIGLGVRLINKNQKSMVTAQVGYGIGLAGGIKNSVIYSVGYYFKLKKLK